MARTRRSKAKPAANAAAAAVKTEADEVEQEEVEETTVAADTTAEDPETTQEDNAGEEEEEEEEEENETEFVKVEVKEEGGANEQLDDHSKLIEAGCTEEVANLVRDLVFNESVMTFADMSTDVVSLLCDFPVDKLDSALKEFVESDFSTIKGDKSTHLRSLLKAWRDDSDEQKSPTSGSPKIKPLISPPKRYDPQLPDEAKIKELVERTGYKHEVSVKGRIYGPPPDVDAKPEHKQEIFVGKLARDVYEDELVPLFEKYGKIYDVKILIEPNSGINRGFAFVSYCNKESLFKAAAELNDHEIRPGKKMKVNVSIPNQRLFVGNVPKQKSKEEILEEFKKVSEGLQDVIVYSNPDDETKKNRGFAFLEYSSHTAAANARQKFLWGVKAFGNSNCSGDWADPEDEPDEETMKTVKILHVRNLSSDVTEEQLKKHFSDPLGEDGLSKICKVKKVKYNAFIEFKEREDAMTVLEAVNDTELGKQKIEVVLAKPNSDKDKRDGRRSRGGPRGGGRGRNNSMSPRGGRGPMGGGRGRGWGSNYGGPQNMSGGGWGGGFSGGSGGYGGYGPQNSSGGWGGNYGGPGWGNGPMHGGNWGSGPNPMRGPGGMGMSRGGGWGGPGGPMMRMGGPGGNWGGPGNWGAGGNWGGGRGGWGGGGMRGGFGGGMRGGFGRGGGNRGGRGRGQKRPRGGGQGRSNGEGNGAAKKPRVEGSGATEKTESGLNNEGPAADWGNQPIAQQPLPKSE